MAVKKMFLQGFMVAVALTFVSVPQALSYPLG